MNSILTFSRVGGTAVVGLWFLRIPADESSRANFSVTENDSPTS